MGQFPLPSPAFQPRPFLKDIKDVKDLLYLTQEEFSAAFKGSAVKRAKRRGLLRNAIAALPGLCTEEMSKSTFPKRLYRLQRLQRPASSEIYPGEAGQSGFRCAYASFSVTTLFVHTAYFQSSH